MKSSLVDSRGSALITAAALTTVMLLAVGGLVYYASQQRGRAINHSRVLTRAACTDAGLQYARAYFGRNYDNWNAYLGDPLNYDPTWIDPARRANPWDPRLRSNHPELFVDLVGDGLAVDAYIYIHDNLDELAPAVDNPAYDNDLIVVVGAICVSSRLTPRRDDGTSSSGPEVQDGLAVEGLLSYNDTTGSPASQRYGNVHSTGNLNTPR